MLGIVPQSHLNILTFSVEDGEMTKQVELDYESKILKLMLTNVLPTRWLWCGLQSNSLLL